MRNLQGKTTKEAARKKREEATISIRKNKRTSLPPPSFSSTFPVNLLQHFGFHCRMSPILFDFLCPPSLSSSFSSSPSQEERIFPNEEFSPIKTICPPTCPAMPLKLYVATRSVRSSSPHLSSCKNSLSSFRSSKLATLSSVIKPHFEFEASFQAVRLLHLLFVTPSVRADFKRRILPFRTSSMPGSSPD